ncbi:MAG: hypothetical protein M1834_003023 [Cirrosporium novae-zelandiae]|nr:MAG: hypothetical protein M1834_003023 [Cirrosporium novae-zelandiae]
MPREASPSPRPESPPPFVNISKYPSTSFLPPLSDETREIYSTFWFKPRTENTEASADGAVELIYGYRGTLIQHPDDTITVYIPSSANVDPVSYSRVGPSDLPPAFVPKFNSVDGWDVVAVNRPELSEEKLARLNHSNSYADGVNVNGTVDGLASCVFSNREMETNFNVNFANDQGSTSSTTISGVLREVAECDKFTQIYANYNSTSLGDSVGEVAVLEEMKTLAYIKGKTLKFRELARLRAAKRGECLPTFKKEEEEEDLR